MPYLNKVTIMGHLGRDAEMKFLQSGKAVAEFTVAVSEKWKDTSTGEDKEKTAWVKCKCFGKWAESAGQMKKGQLVLVDGKLDQETWDDKDSGKKREKTGVLANAVYALQSLRKDASPAPPAAPPQHPLPIAPADAPKDDDVPF